MTTQDQETATVILFKETGKYYTSEEWRIPEAVRNEFSGRYHAPISPADMEQSPDFRRIGDGPVLIETQEPWGYPHLL